MASLKRPDLPKRLAARVRAAQLKYRAAMDAHVGDEMRILEHEEKLQAFESDPWGWTMRRYPKCDGPDSYPPQTHISRVREELADWENNREAVQFAIEEAAKNLAEVEAEVLAQVSAMKFTEGRVPWPSRPPTLETLFRRAAKRADANQLYAERYQERRKLQQERDVEREAIKQERDDERLRRRREREIREMVAKGPEHTLCETLYNRGVIDGFTEALRGRNSQPQGFGDVFSTFVNAVQGPGKDAGRIAVTRAMELIAEAKSEGRDLWDLCREHGCYTPDTLPHLD